MGVRRLLTYVLSAGNQKGKHQLCDVFCTYHSFEIIQTFFHIHISFPSTMKTSALILSLYIGTASALSASFTDSLGGGSPLSGGGMAGYLDALPPNAAPISGGGLAGYLDSFTASAPVAPAPAAPQPVAAVAAPAAPYVAEASTAIDTSLSGGGVPSYTALLAVGAQTSGGGVSTHTDLLSIGAQTSGAGIASYTGALGTNPATTTGPGIGAYTDSLGVKSAAGIPPSTGAGIPSKSGSSTFLGGIYNMIMDLDPEEVNGAGGRLDKDGDDLTFAVGDSNEDEAIAMSFIRRG